MAILNPAPRGPRMLPSGILQSSKMMLAVDEALMPNLSSFFPRESPGCGMGTRNALIPCRHGRQKAGKKAPKVREGSPSFQSQQSSIYLYDVNRNPVRSAASLPCVWAACLWWRTQQWQTHPSCWWSRLWFRSAPTHLPPHELLWRQHLRRCHYLQFKLQVWI